MNLARIACPNLGTCRDSSCPYNHQSARSSGDSFSGSAFANQREVEGMTGRSGQYVGSRKGGNAVPVRQTGGDLPAFLQNRLREMTVRSGGNEREIRGGALAHIPAKVSNKNHQAPVDWKAVATSSSRANAVQARREELVELVSLRDERRRAMRLLDEEIKELQEKLLHKKKSESIESMRAVCREVSVNIADAHDRSTSFLKFVEEERHRLLGLLISVGKSGLTADTMPLVKEQERIFDEIKNLFQATRNNIEFIGTEFRANANARLGSRGS